MLIAAARILIEGPSFLRQIIVAVGASVVGGAVGAAGAIIASNRSLTKSAGLAKEEEDSRRVERRQDALNALIAELSMNGMVVSEQLQGTGDVPVLSHVALDNALPHLPSLPEGVQVWVERSHFLMVRYNAVAALRLAWSIDPTRVGGRGFEVGDNFRAIAAEAVNAFAEARKGLAGSL